MRPLAIDCEFCLPIELPTALVLCPFSLWFGFSPNATDSVSLTVSQSVTKLSCLPAYQMFVCLIQLEHAIAMPKTPSTINNTHKLKRGLWWTGRLNNTIAIAANNLQVATQSVYLAMLMYDSQDQENTEYVDLNLNASLVCCCCCCCHHYHQY